MSKRSMMKAYRQWEQTEEGQRFVAHKRNLITLADAKAAAERAKAHYRQVADARYSSASRPEVNAATTKWAAAEEIVRIAEAAAKITENWQA